MDYTNDFISPSNISATWSLVEACSQLLWCHLVRGLPPLGRWIAQLSKMYLCEVSVKWPDFLFYLSLYIIYYPNTGCNKAYNWTVHLLINCTL
jgi:hypothetical protein